jgi:hypothetical protein
LAPALSRVPAKTVIGSRLKPSAMFWTVRGANAILALRCAHPTIKLTGRTAGPPDSHLYVAHPKENRSRKQGRWSAGAFVGLGVQSRVSVTRAPGNTLDKIARAPQIGARRPGSGRRSTIPPIIAP